MKHIINLDADPLIPYDSWSVEEHQKGGKVEWPFPVKLYLSPKQKIGTIEGNDLRAELKDKPVLNANVLDYLLDHPRLIPEEWKKDEKGNTRYIPFWGTIYRDAYGRLCVRFLYFRGGRWQAGYRWLGGGFDDRLWAALRASTLTSDTNTLPFESRLLELEKFQKKVESILKL